MGQLLLAADVGGTKIHLGLYRIGPEGPEPVRFSTVPTSSYGSLSGALDTFLLLDGLHLAGACLGVAGPVLDGEVAAPNLPWKVTLSEIRNALGIESVELLNDLVACAWSIPGLAAEKLETLQAGRPDSKGTRALIAPGTGLGAAVIPFSREGYRPIPSEGGHADFAPLNEEQYDLVRFLHVVGYEHVSWEIVSSGPGLKLIYDFLTETGEQSKSDRVEEKLSMYDPSSVISSEGLARTDPACTRALSLYAEILGAACGNLALTALSTGGLYIGGGVAPKILPALREEGFRNALRNKGRMSWIVEAIPVKVITDEKAALHGAALCGWTKLRA